MKQFSNLDMQPGTKVNGLVPEVLTTNPSTNLVAGRTYYNSASGILLTYDGAGFKNLATDSQLLNGQNAAFYLARANHTGTQLAATISDLATTVQAYRLDQFAAPTNPVSFNSQRITNVADPSAAQDAATMGWVQTQVANAAAGIDSKPSVRALANTNITLSGTQTIDGVAVVAGNRVLVRGQSTASQNGVYVVAAGAWTRALDADENQELTPGAFWFVEEGTTYGKTQWRIENTGTIVVGTTNITINQFGASTSYVEGNGIDITGNTISAQVVASGGIEATAGGLQVDATIVARKNSGTIGNGSNSTLTFTHNLGTKDVVVSLRLVATDEVILADVVATDTNTVSITFATAPAASSVRVTVIG